MIRAIHKLICTMIDTKMFIKADVDQAVITTPTICVDDTVNICFATDNGL